MPIFRITIMLYGNHNFIKKFPLKMILRFKINYKNNYEHFKTNNKDFIYTKNKVKCKYCDFSTLYIPDRGLFQLKQHLKSLYHQKNVSNHLKYTMS